MEVNGLIDLRKGPIEVDHFLARAAFFSNNAHVHLLQRPLSVQRVDFTK